MRLAGEMICVRPSHHLPVYGDPAALRAAAAGRVAAWKRAQAPAPVVIPPFEVAPRPAVPDEISGTARSLAKLAWERGWHVVARYARGPYRSGSTDRARITVSDLVRINLAARGVQLVPGTPAVSVRAVGCWADGRTTGAFWWVDGRLPQPMGVEALQLLLSQTVVVLGR